MRKLMEVKEEGGGVIVQGERIDGVHNLNERIR